MTRRVRHIKRQSTYEVLGEAEVQISNPMIGRIDDPKKFYRLLSEGDNLIVYRSEIDGKLYARFPDEFNDGRFEDILNEPLRLREAASQALIRLGQVEDFRAGTRNSLPACEAAIEALRAALK